MNAQTIQAVGYTQASFRTEYEYVMAYRVGKLYAVMADDSGTVTSLTDKMITVTYKSGDVVAIPIGRHFGSAEGSTYPNDIVTQLKLNQKFNKSDCIVYNTGFFEVDWLDKTKIVYKSSMLCTTTMSETNEVFEDSSAISVDLADRLATKNTKVRSFIVNFSQNIVNMLPLGSKLKPEDVLFLITDEDTTESSLTEDAIILLKRLSNIAPKAKVIGTLDKIEILYNGDIADMSPSLRKLTNASNADFYASTKGTEAEIKDGAVNHEYRVSGKNLQVDSLELRLYISVVATAGAGDKIVFASQMKSIAGDVFSYSMVSESGVKIDAQFGERGFAKRVVISPKLMGTTNRLLKAASKSVADLYFS